ncbi:MAG: Succinyl-CoA ligase (ADP-forming) subunit alpha [Syntrophaceae bacterium PtaB.Bin095]|jgi:acetyltransferase|nr:MAG: Succinyl-CoA ligase (ADP-forming) subunit alpha [Syntrophaceae bacterium PtaB.Bin095]
MVRENGRGVRSLFEPRSIALIGASGDPGKIGHAVLKNVITGGYAGKIYPVNGRGGEVVGLHAFRSILDIGEPIDLACITIPAKGVYDAIVQCAEKGVRNAVVITSGFSEIGNFEEEKKIVAYARAREMRILGPNVFGVYSSRVGLNATFIAGDIPSGHLAMITQSGALGLTLVGQASVQNIGLSAIVSVGNKADIDESDLLGYLGDHDDTRIVLMYVEGVRDGEKFIRAVGKTTRKKPVIVIKSGRSAKGAQAAASHTGSLAGSDAVFDDLIRQCGALRAESAKEAFNWAMILGANPLPEGGNTVIITNGGGVGVMAADACEKYGVDLYDDSRNLKRVFSSIIPGFGSARNPVDLTGQATAADYTRAFDAALEAPDIHTVFGIYCETALSPSTELDAIVAENFRKYQSRGKLILFSLFGGQKVDEYLTAAKKRGMPVSDDVYETASSLGVMHRYKRYVENCTDGDSPADITLDAAPIAGIVSEARRKNRYFLLAHEAQQIMRMTGIPIPKSLQARTVRDAVEAANAVGYPVVMKIVSRDIIHKSDAGGIALDLENEEEVADAYSTIVQNCKRHVPHAVIEGVDISEMVRPGTELIVGARMDPTFGPTMMAGLGGIYVEVMKDVAFRSLPAGARDLMDMIKELRSYPLLLGVRGEKMKDIRALTNVIVILGAILRQCRGITDIEINPLVVYEQGEGVRAVDVRIILEK